MPNRILTVFQQMGWRAFLRGLLFIAVLAGLGYLGKEIDFEGSFRAFNFTLSEDAPWYRGPIGFTLLGAAALCISCPRQLVSFLGAYFFGLWVGFGAALAATVIACIASFSVARIFQGYFREKIRGKLDIAVQFWRENTFSATMIFRFLPVGSNLLTNFAAGALGIPGLRFISGSAVGYIPQTLVFAFLGSGVKVESGTQLLVSVLLFGLSALLGTVLYARYRKRLKSSPKESAA